MLDDVKHVEACALLQKVMADVGHLVPYRAAIEGWLEENHPSTDAYMTTMRHLAESASVSA